MPLERRLGAQRLTPRATIAKNMTSKNTLRTPTVPLCITSRLVDNVWIVAMNMIAIRYEYDS